MSASSAGQPDASLVWKKSSYSSNDGPECVEVADAAGTVHVRDSKSVTGPRITCSAGAWAGFLVHATTR
ncbi:DUF397 domain-containing protein [Streptomyces albus]|uniref:DUF397 domain-containing protein n=1 Tax=Streptomyces albus TaxID=1888 RepID=UPI00055A681B|nr:DUF397 domain-containing protein [Streptomyces albus]MDI6412356.1 DUF397 domain-containing protein [Streptomyces albus]GHJ19556.1 DUF397 domain-containing protein [Streptomyces albus]GHJ23712.1 DUF397 domain-containing protein [Streptomyces albus]